MKVKYNACDVCGQELINDHYKIKIKFFHEDYVNFDDFDFNKWRKFEMCDNCRVNFVKWLTSKKLKEQK